MPQCSEAPCGRQSGKDPGSTTTYNTNVSSCFHAQVDYNRFVRISTATLTCESLYSSCQPGKMEYNHRCAPVAQLDRVTVYGTVGYRFDSCRAHHS